MHRSLGWLAILISGGWTVPVHAGILAASLTIQTVGGSENSPLFILQNQSATAEIVRIDVTIGDPTRNFDALATDDDGNGSFTNVTGGHSGSGISYTIPNLDTNASGGLRSDVLSITFGNFAPSLDFRFRAEIDADTGDTGENFGQVFFNNGSADNTRLSITFADGAILSLLLPESPEDLLDSSGQRYQFTLTDPFTTATPLPEPAPLWLVLAGLGLLLARRQTRFSHPVSGETPCVTPPSR